MKPSELIKEQLVVLYGRFGREIWENSARLRGFLNDCCPAYECKKYIRAVIMVVEMGIPQEICVNNTGTVNVFMRRSFIARILQEYPMHEDYADAAIDACCAAMGLEKMQAGDGQTKGRKSKDAKADAGIDLIEGNFSGKGFYTWPNGDC